MPLSSALNNVRSYKEKSPELVTARGKDRLLIDQGELLSWASADLWLKWSAAKRFGQSVHLIPVICVSAYAFQLTAGDCIGVPCDTSEAALTALPITMRKFAGYAIRLHKGRCGVVTAKFSCVYKARLMLLGVRHSRGVTNSVLALPSAPVNVTVLIRCQPPPHCLEAGEAMVSLAQLALPNKRGLTCCTVTLG